MNPVESTAEVLVYKALNRDIDKVWVDWAIEMLMAGFDTEHLVILAGENAPSPYNQFYLQKLVDKVLDELHIDFSNTGQVIRDYVYYLINGVLNSRITALDALNILKNICDEVDCEKDTYNFSLLYWAKEDLLYTDKQWYWEGANKGNIDEIITKYFIEWKLLYESKR